MSCVGAALAAVREQLPAGEARLLLTHLLQRNSAWLIAHDDFVLDENHVGSFSALIARRVAGEPIAYLLNAREFYGRDFEVSPAVLIPRPETELLVDLAKAKVGVGGTARILDLGTGSGCIAITLALECPLASISAVDNSAAALGVAQRNAGRLGARVTLLQSDWFGSLAEQPFDLIVSNPPYISDGDSHLAQGDLRYEPTSALASGADGLAAIRQIVAAAHAYLADGGSLWIEHGYDQATQVAALLAVHGYRLIEQHRDLAGIVRISGGYKIPAL